MTSHPRTWFLAIAALASAGVFAPGCDGTPTGGPGGSDTGNGGHAGGGDSPASGAQGGDSASMGGNSSGASDGSGGAIELYPSVPACDDDVPCSEGACRPIYRVCVECNNYEHCAPHHDCIAHLCHPLQPCETEQDCESDRPVCRQHQALGGHCVECVTHSDCGEGYVCRDTSCIATCVTDNDCAAPRGVCNGETCGECHLDTGCSDDEYCHVRSCRRKVCLPGTSHCLGSRTVKCNATGSGYVEATSCSSFPCHVVNGQGQCSFPDGDDEIPAHAVNTNGHLTGSESTWLLNNRPLTLTNGMFCFTNVLDEVYRLVWPGNADHAATLIMDQDYILKFRTSAVSSHQLAPVISFEVEVSDPGGSPIYFTTSVDVSEGVQYHELPFTMYRHAAPAGIKITMTSRRAELCLDNVWIVPKN